MFERFTDRARRVLVLAQEETRAFSHNFIGTEHILLGLIGEEHGIAAKVLTNAGFKLNDLRDKIEEAAPQTATYSTGSPPFTPRAKKLLELSLREALQLGCNYIGTEHMLLGMIRYGEGEGYDMLAQKVDPAELRKGAIEMLSQRIEQVAAKKKPIPFSSDWHIEPDCFECVKCQVGKTVTTVTYTYRVDNSNHCIGVCFNCHDIYGWIGH